MERLATPDGDVAGDVPSAADAVEVEGPVPAARRGGPAAPAVTAWAFSPGEPPRQVDVDQVGRLAEDDDGLVWVDLSGHAAPDLRAVAERLALPEAAVAAALASWHRPRLARFGDVYLVSATVAELGTPSERSRVYAGQLDLFVRRNALVSAQQRPLPFADRVLDRAAQSADLPRLDASYLLYVVLDELVAHAERLAEAQIEAMEERSVGDAADDFLDDPLHLKRAVFALGRLVDQYREHFAVLLRPEFLAAAGGDLELYLRDLEGRLGHLRERLAAAKQSVDGAFDIYVSQVAHRTNEVMRLLTVVSTLLLPASVILGLFGTAFEGVPLYSRAAFAAMVAAIALVTGVILLAFRRRGWLDRGRG